jgi:hypothetical protein
MYRQFLASILSVSVLLGPFSGSQVEASTQAAAPKAGTADQQAMDKLLAPVALYPDALLAQALACAGSPQQVTEVNKWLQQNSQLQGTELQQAAETAGFDASFIAMVLFPDVLKLLEQNLPWATELGKAFINDQKSVLESVQRLRAQAKAAGNLKTTAQQEVKTETQNGQTVIVVQPANPQVVYVPVYNTVTVYAAPPPAQSNSGDVAAAAVIGFAVGIALGAAMNDNYGYYGWGMHWHSSVVVVHGGVWRAPVGRYGYARPVAGYHPNRNINAPRQNNVNINVNNNNINNVNRQNVNTGGRTRRPTTTSSAVNRTGGAKTPAAGTARSQPAGNAYRGRAQATSSGAASPAKQIERGSSTSAFSGYQKGSSEKTASMRGRKSARSTSGGGRRK